MAHTTSSIMKSMVALVALLVLVAHVAAYTDSELVQRSLCTADYQCKDNCRCESPKPSVPKMCFCYSPTQNHEVLVCRRSEYL